MLSNHSLRRRLAIPVIGILIAAGGSVLATSQAQAASSSYCNLTGSQPTLSNGSSGTAVRQAQCEINYAFAYGKSTNYGNGAYGGLKIDGSFGANTLAATKAFQKCAGISADGVIGPDTWSELNRWVTSPNYC